MFQPYRRSQIAELRPYVAGEMLSDRVSVSASDKEAGSPKVGDMIARNPKNNADQWLVAAAYFADNFEPASAQAPAPDPYMIADLRKQALAHATHLALQAPDSNGLQKKPAEIAVDAECYLNFLMPKATSP